MVLPDEIYVVITERDMTPEDEERWKNYPSGTVHGPLLGEYYLDDPEKVSLEAARRRIQNLNGCYGEAKIAKLTIVE